MTHNKEFKEILTDADKRVLATLRSAKNNRVTNALEQYGIKY